MTPERPDDDPRIERPRGEIEIIPPGERARGEPAPRHGFESASFGRAFVFRPRGGILSTFLVALGAAAMFALLLGTFALVASVAAVAIAAFYLRNSIRRWLGR